MSANAEPTTVTFPIDDIGLAFVALVRVLRAQAIAYEVPGTMKLPPLALLEAAAKTVALQPDMNGFAAVLLRAIAGDENAHLPSPIAGPEPAKRLLSSLKVVRN